MEKVLRRGRVWRAFCWRPFSRRCFWRRRPRQPSGNAGYHAARFRSCGRFRPAPRAASAQFERLVSPALGYVISTQRIEPAWQLHRDGNVPRGTSFFQKQGRAEASALCVGPACRSGAQRRAPSSDSSHSLSTTAWLRSASLAPNSSVTSPSFRRSRQSFANAAAAGLPASSAR